MKKIEALCPRCGRQIALMEYGHYLSRRFNNFEHTYEGWCPFCSEHVVEHVALSGPLEHKMNENNFTDIDIYVD